MIQMSGVHENEDRSLISFDLVVIHDRFIRSCSTFIPAIHNFHHFLVLILKNKCDRVFIHLISTVALNNDRFQLHLRRLADMISEKSLL